MSKRAEDSLFGKWVSLRKSLLQLAWRAYMGVLRKRNFRFMGAKDLDNEPLFCKLILLTKGGKYYILQVGEVDYYMPHLSQIGRKAAKKIFGEEVLNE